LFVVVPVVGTWNSRFRKEGGEFGIGIGYEFVDEGED